MLLKTESTTAVNAGVTVNGGTINMGSGVTPPGSRPFLRAFASADQAGTLNVQQSPDGSTWYITVTQAVAAGSTAGTVVESLISLPFVRAQYVNGGTNQGAFILATALVN